MAQGTPQGFLTGFKISDDGRSERLPPGINDGSLEQKYWVWIVLDPDNPKAHDWLRQEAGLSEQVCDALLAVDTRPRCLISDDGALLILRGINADPRSQPTDMVSVRIWIEDDRVITVQRRQLAAADALRQSYEKGTGPKSSAEFVVALADGMLARLRDVLAGLEQEIDKLEDETANGPLRGLRRRLVNVRHATVPLRRYLAPQRDALSHLMAAKLPWLNDWWQSHLHEFADEVSRYIEALDAIRESANIVQDALNVRLAEQTNRSLVILSIAAAAFLPLNLFTGLLGSNVKGIPGAESPYAFWVVIAICIGILIFEAWLFRRLKLMRFFK